MNFPNNPESFHLDDYEVSFNLNARHDLILTESETNETQVFSLETTPLYLKIVQNGTGKVLQLGRGELNAPHFTRMIRSTDSSPLTFSNSLEVIGMGDMRDVRMAYTYNLEGSHIAILSDGLDIKFFGPGDLSDGIPTWFSEEKVVSVSNQNNI